MSLNTIFFSLGKPFLLSATAIFGLAACGPTVPKAPKWAEDIQREFEALPEFVITSTSFDPRLVGTWSHQSDQEGMAFEILFTFESSGQVSQKWMLDGSVVSDLEQTAASDTAAHAQVRLTVTRVNVDLSEEAAEVGQQDSCIYEVVESSSELKLECSGDGSYYPAAFTDESLILKKK